MQLRASSLKDENLLEEFYDKIIENYYSVENYLILLIHAVYDIPGKSSDGEEMFDASDGSVCPYSLLYLSGYVKQAGAFELDEESNAFHTRICDRVVNMPDIGFLFPAFHDRSTDVHSLLYYVRQSRKNCGWNL